MKILISNQQNHRRLDRTKIKKVARKTLSLLKQPMAELSILFVDDEKTRQLNAAFRGVDKTTDVLSFPQVEFGVRSSETRTKLQARNYILGDIVINIQGAALRAKLSGSDFYDEVYHLLIHGILHLLGYDHERSQYKARAMVKKEREILYAIKKIC